VKPGTRFAWIIPGSQVQDEMTLPKLLIVIEREKPQSLTEFASGAGWYSPHGKPDKTKAYRAMIKLIAKKLVAVQRKYGNGNDRRYRLTKGGHAALDRHIFKQSF
jgi:DNA-binding PadR family transcriptional regulator